MNTSQSKTSTCTSKLDLHGVLHRDVKITVQDFVLNNQILPLQIVHGNSNKMKALVMGALDEIQVQYTSVFLGQITVIKL